LKVKIRIRPMQILTASSLHHLSHYIISVIKTDDLRQHDCHYISYKECGNKKLTAQ